MKKICMAFVVMVMTLGILHSCTDEGANINDPSDIKMIRYVAGNNQTERAGAVLPIPLTIRVEGMTGIPISGEQVTFSSSAVGSALSPEVVATGTDGIASTVFQLGSVAGAQTVGVRIEADTAFFTQTAVPPGCPEESLTPAGDWTSGHIYVVTTSSTFLSGSGSVVIEYDPIASQSTKLFETTEILRDIAFSPRGEMFLAADDRVYKVTPGTYVLEIYTTFTSATSALAPNYGSVLTRAGGGVLSGIFCGTDATTDLSIPSLSNECLAVDPVTRDPWVVTGDNPTFTLSRYLWDGRSAFGTADMVIYANTGSGTPRGICVDSTGVLYVSVDDITGSNRYVGRVNELGQWEEDFYDIYSFYSNARIGDITYSNGSLYLIDTNNNRIITLAADGSNFRSTANNHFSAPGSAGERYGIAAAP